MTGTSVYSAAYLIHERKIPAETIARAIQKLDNESCPTYDFDITGAAEEVQNPDVKFFFLVDDNTFKIVGYLDIIALNDKDYKKVIEGTFKDGELVSGSIDRHAEVNLYIRGFVIGPDFRSNTGNFKLMVKSLMEWIFNIPREFESKVISVTARGLTDHGAQLCRAFGMTELRKHKVKGTIYEFLWNQTSNPEAPTRYGKKCRKTYNQ